MDLVEVGWGDVDWIALAQDRDKWRALVNSGSIKCWETIECEIVVLEEVTAQILWFSSRWLHRYCGSRGCCCTDIVVLEEVAAQIYCGSQGVDCIDILWFSRT
jgi:hypothetical protein